VTTITIWSISSSRDGSGEIRAALFPRPSLFSALLGDAQFRRGRGCWEDVKKLLFVYVPQRAPAIALSPRADCGLAFSQRSGRRNHRLRSKFLPQDIRRSFAIPWLPRTAVANFFRLTGNRVLKAAFVLRDGLSPPKPLTSLSPSLRALVLTTPGLAALCAASASPSPVDSSQSPPISTRKG
jgi:hypothetical protein